MDGIFSLKNTKYLFGAVNCAIRTIVDLLISLWIYPTHSILSEQDILVLLCRDGPVATRSRFLQSRNRSVCQYMEMTHIVPSEGTVLLLEDGLCIRHSPVLRKNLGEWVSENTQNEEDTGKKHESKMKTVTYSWWSHWRVTSRSLRGAK